MDNITSIAQMVANIVITQLKESASMTDIERVTQKVMHQIGQASLEKTINAQVPTYPEPLSLCSCSKEAPYKRKRTTKLYTLLGTIRVSRPYYLCPDCHCGHYPLDRQLGLRPNALSAELSRVVALTGVQLPFKKGCELFEELTLISLSDPTMRKATLQVGQLVQQQEQEMIEKADDAQYVRHLKRNTKPPLRLYGTIDAVKVPVRDDPEQKWRDLKLIAWFEARGQPPSQPEGQWSIKAHNLRYHADIDTAKSFGSLLWGTAVATQANMARELIILGDGASWIWNLVDTHLPDAIQILDWFHAVQHLTPVAQVAFTETSQQKAWLTFAKDLMWQGQIEQLIASIDTLAQTCSHDVLRKTANYYEGHQHRMRYDHFRRQGYQIGSGTIESAAKQIGLMRMKIPGARWNVQEARLMAKARASFLTDKWAELPLAF